MGFILDYSSTFSLVEIPSSVELSLLLSYSCNHSEPAYFRVRDFPLWPTKRGELIFLVMDRTFGFVTVQNTQQLQLLLDMDRVLSKVCWDGSIK